MADIMMAENKVRTRIEVGKLHGDSDCRRLKALNRAMPKDETFGWNPFSTFNADELTLAEVGGSLTLD